MDNNTESNTQLSTQIRQYLILSLEYWYLFVLAILISVVFFGYKNKFAYSEYGVYTTVLIKKQGSNPELVAGGLLLSPSRNLDNEMGFIQSYEMVNRVIKELDFRISYFLDNKIGYDPELYKNCPFIVELDTSKSQYYYNNIKIKIVDENNFELEIPNFDYSNNYSFGEKISIDNFGFTIYKNDSIFNSSHFKNDYFFYMNNEATLTKTFKDKLKVELSPERSSILWIWIEGKVPQKNIDFLNTMVGFYIEDRLYEKNLIAEKTIDFIDMQLDGFSDSLRKSEDDLQYFKQINSINISDQGQNLLERMQEFDNERKLKIMKQEYYEYMITVADNNPEDLLVMSPSILGFSDPVLEQYFIVFSDAIAEQSVLQFSIKEDANLPPNVIRTKEIENLQLKIKQHISQTIKYTKKSLTELDTKVNELQNEIYKLPLAERQMLQITRQFDLNNEIYTFLLQRRMEAGITLASNTPDVTVIDKSRIETMIYNGRNGGGNLPKTFLIAFFIVAIIIFIREVLKNKIESKFELEKLISVPIISSINYNHQKTELPTIEHQKSSISETFRLLRTNLQYSLTDKKEKLIVVSSTISGEGKSFISTNLAAIISATNKKTVIVGLDLRKPKIKEIFELEKNSGVSDYIIGNISYEELIQPTKYKNLFVIAPGTIPPNPAELIDSQKMSNLLDKVKQEFDYVVVDTPPVGIVADALLLIPKADVFLYVIRQDYSNKSSVKLLNEIITNNKLKNVGIVFNGVKKTVKYGLKYGYGGYGSTYSQGQGYYDDEKLSDKEKNLLKRINEAVLKLFMQIFRIKQ